METSVIIASILIANIFGVLLHFTHGRKSKSILIHIISSINESTWEHLKLAFMPMLLITCIQPFILTNSNIFEANTYAILITLISIPLLYYPIKALLKKTILWITILIFVVSVTLGYFVEYLILTNSITLIGNILSIFILVTLFLMFVLFTFTPPKMFLFKDPIKGTYGHKI